MRYLILLGISLVDVIFANTIFPNINIAGIAPDIIICTMVSITIFENNMTGAWLGLLCGLFIDFFGGITGFYTLPYFLTGAFIYFVRNNIRYIDRFLMPASFAAGACIFKEILISILAYMLNKQFSLSYMFFRYFLPEAALTAALMFVIHFLMMKLYRLNYLKKKSDKDFKHLS